MSGSDAVGIAFIGCGSYNAGLAAAAARSEKLKCVGCFDVRPEQATGFAERFGMRAYGSLEELAEDQGVAGVVIASPNNAHRQNIEAALAGNKHIFVDKPIANTIEDALAIIQMTADAGRLLSVGHNGRRNAGHRKMKEMIRQGAIGDAVCVEANFSHSGGLGLTPEQWRFYRDECPGLPLMQLGVHFADTVQYLLGEVKEVASFMSHVATPADNVDNTVTLLKFEGGLLGYLGSNYATPSVYYVNVYGTGGNLHCEGGGSLLYRKADTSEKVPVGLVGTDPQLEELQEFADAILGRAEIEVDGYQALRALAVVQGALRSAETGQPVNLDELIAGVES